MTGNGVRHAIRLARKVDTILMQRCDAVLPVLERSTDCHNLMAVVRTAEAFGEATNVLQYPDLLTPSLTNRHVSDSAPGASLKSCCM